MYLARRTPDFHAKHQASNPPTQLVCMLTKVFSLILHFYNPLSCLYSDWFWKRRAMSVNKETGKQWLFKVMWTRENILLLTDFNEKVTSMILLFPLIGFGGPEALFCIYILLCRPSEDSLQWSTNPDGRPSQYWESTEAGDIAGFEPRSAGSQSGVATIEPLLLPYATTTP